MFPSRHFRFRGSTLSLPPPTFPQCFIAHFSRTKEKLDLIVANLYLQSLDISYQRFFLSEVPGPARAKEVAEEEEATLTLPLFLPVFDPREAMGGARFSRAGERTRQDKGVQYT